MMKNLIIKDELLKGLLINARYASKNHYQADCPFCLKTQHFYINRVNQKWDCKKCSESGNVYKLLEKIDALDFIENQSVIHLNKPLSSISQKTTEQEEDVDMHCETVKMPEGFKRSFEDEYLSSRGFKEPDYQKYVVGYCKKDFKLKDYIIIGIFEEGQLKGYIGRLTWDTGQMRDFERKNGVKKPKYLNNGSASFSKLVGGIDEVSFLTKTVILVEGFFDKKNLDDKMKLNRQHKIKCCFTFGKKVSRTQALKLLAKGVKNLIIIQDPDAVTESKKYSTYLQKFFNVMVGFIDSDRDLGEMCLSEITEVLSNLKKPEQFKIERVQKRKL
jgi:hypothetical protein